jgi:protein-tyrosine phosphatase
VDERICQLLESDKILTLADGGRYILLELPHNVFIDIEPLLAELASIGVEVIISHPERHPVIAENPEIVVGWLVHSVHLQVTAASLLGDFGPAAQRAGWYFLSSRWASLVATDSHDLGARRPRMRDAFESINTELGETIARLVCIGNPLNVLRGQDVISVCSISTRKCSNERV